MVVFSRLLVKLNDCLYYRISELCNIFHHIYNIAKACLFHFCSEIIHELIIDKMKTETRKIKSISEILQQECKEKKGKEIKLDVYCDGTLYMVNKLSMYFRVPTGEYMIVLFTDSGGYLVNTVLDLRRAESEFSYLVAMSDKVKQETP